MGHEEKFYYRRYKTEEEFQKAVKNLIEIKKRNFNEINSILIDAGSINSKHDYEEFNNSYVYRKENIIFDEHYVIYIKENNNNIDNFSSSLQKGF